MTPWLVKVVVLGALLIASACGALPKTGDVASGSRTPSATSQAPSPAPGYLAYTHSTLMYSFEYPSTWTVVSIPIPGTLLTNAPTRGPQDFQPTDIDFRISVYQQPSRPCSIPTASGARINNPAQQVVIDGTPATLYLAPNGAEAWALHNGWCYDFGAITVDAADRDLHLPEIEHILSSFKFNR